MDHANFERVINDPRRTREELEQILKNCLDKQQLEFAYIAKQALNKRFPGWDKPAERKAGAVPTIARFRNETIEFPSQREAYGWLIERFIHVQPSVLQGPHWETDFVAKGKGRRYFAQSPHDLFSRKSKELIDNPGNFLHLSNGWYANMDLSSEQKLAVLTRFASIAKFGEDEWTWTPIEKSQSLKNNEDKQARSEGLLKKMRQNLMKKRKQ